MRTGVACVFAFVLAAPITPLSAQGLFDRELFGEPTSLRLIVEQLDRERGTVRLNGSDHRRPSIPFQFEWGDGKKTEGFFPQQHTYRDPKRNYVVTVTARYGGTTTDTIWIPIRFVASTVVGRDPQSRFRVSVPTQMPKLGTRLYSVPVGLEAVSRRSMPPRRKESIEHILTAAAQIQFELVNGDVDIGEGRFQQIVLIDPDSSGASALWFTDPHGIAIHPGLIESTINYSSLFHESAHNITLNFPAEYIHGGKTDGPANTIYSETVAQILQHVTAEQVVRRSREFEIPDDLAFDIANSARTSIALLRNFHDTYRRAGMPFASWNEPSTPEDETQPTFMTLAYKFFEIARHTGTDHAVAAKRMFTVFGLFDEDIHRRYSQHKNSPEAEAARATYIVAAYSYAFGEDLRAEFQRLNFPADTPMYRLLLARLRKTE